MKAVIIIACFVVIGLNVNHLSYLKGVNEKLSQRIIAVESNCVTHKHTTNLLMDWSLAEFTISKPYERVMHYTNTLFREGWSAENGPHPFYVPVMRRGVDHAAILQQNKQDVQLGLRSDGVVVWRKK